MKTTLAVLFLSLFFITGGITEISAQVTIGTGEETVKGALLQLKEKESITDDACNAYRGLGLPRVTLSDKRQLYPMFLTDPDIATSGPNAEYTANKATLDKTHTGLIVYNLVEDEDKDLCLGLNQWDGEQWTCFQQKPTSAQFTFDCASIAVMGDYGDGIALNSSHYIRLQLNVTRVGSYSISATSTPDNGYFYETTGIFYSTGTFTITIPGTGQPVTHTQGVDLVNPGDDTPDHFTLTSSGGGADCAFDVNVRSTAAHPEFTLDCAGTVVKGTYFEDQPLSSAPSPINGESHQLVITLKDIPASALGSLATVETNSVDGFSFKGSAIISSYPAQTITIPGTGVPRGLNDKVLTITSNSESSTASCSATVYMLIPAKRLMAVGQTQVLDIVYGYNPARNTTRNPKNCFNTLLTDKDNFGYSQWSILKFAGFNNVGSGRDNNFIPNTNPDSWADDGRDIIGLEIAGWRNMSAAKLESLLMGFNGKPKIDIFMMGYTGLPADALAEYFRSTPTADAALDQAKCQKLVDFAKSGGILMVCQELPISNRNFLRLFFNDNTINTGSGATAGANYTLGFNLGNMPADMRPYYCYDDDPILKGPFENILGRNWGEDASTTVYVTYLPLDEVVIYSGAREIGNTSRPADGVTIFRHKEYPFVFIGDAGFNSSEARTYWNTTSSVCPFQLTSKVINGKTYNNYPTYRFNFGGSGNRVYNTTFTANAFAWCIYQAEEYRRAHR
ncbi:MAG: hypothetical protein LBN74_10930 [Prevotella sp.]|jgi:hypothetical protein|nr:hypothetical protein [Prevotella sp.]